MKDCIPNSAPYLSHPLKLDNLPPICKHVSEHVLHNRVSVGVRLDHRTDHRNLPPAQTPRTLFVP